MIRIAGRVTTMLALAGCGMTWSAPAAWADDVETVTRLDIAAEIRGDGSTHVHETMTYDFGRNRRHGIRRDLPRRDDGFLRNRLYVIDRVRASTPDGVRLPVRVNDDDRLTKVRVGDPGSTVTGVRTYTLDYDLRFALTREGDRVELVRDFVGGQWDAVVRNITVRVSGPGIISASCAGNGCDATRSADGVIMARKAALSGGDDAVKLTVKLRKGAAGVPAARYGPYPWQAWPPAVGAIAACVVLSLWFSIVLPRYWRFAERKTSGRRRETPPAILRPGRAGALWFPRPWSLVGDREIVATLIDLAVRGHLRIDETTEARVDAEDATDAEDTVGHDEHQAVWTLTAQHASRDEPSGLSGYEAALLRDLFADHGTLRLKEPADHRHVLQCGRPELAGDLRGRRWLLRRPELLRAGIATGVAVAAVASMGFGFTTPLFPGGDDLSFAFALVAVLSPLIGTVALIASYEWVADHEPERTWAGRRLMRRLAGYRGHLATVPAEEADLMAAHTPYAIALDVSGAWLRRVGRMEHPVSWFSGSSGVQAFTESLLGTTVSGRRGSPGASSSGGYSSGGHSGSGGYSGGFSSDGFSSGGSGGGGGGGSW